MINFDYQFPVLGIHENRFAESSQNPEHHPICFPDTRMVLSRLIRVVVLLLVKQANPAYREFWVSFEIKGGKLTMEL